MRVNILNRKYSASRRPQIPGRTPAVPLPQRGARDRHGRGAGCGGRFSASGAELGGRAGQLREPSNETLDDGAEAYGEGVWFWHPLLVLNPRSFCGPDRVLQNRQSPDAGAKRNSSPGTAHYNPQNTYTPNGRRT